MRLSLSERIFHYINYALLSIMGLIALFPVFYVLVVSVTPYLELVRNGGFVVFPRQITFQAYGELLQDPGMMRAFANSIYITVVSTAIGVLLSLMLAYGLTNPSMPGRNVILFLLLLTMLFHGGLIPQYMLVKSLGLLNTYWVLILSGTVSVFNVLVMKSFIENLPHNLEEAALIDGTTEIGYLFRIVIPLSAPIIATIGLFYAVTHWNAFFEAILYVSDTDKHPLQTVLRAMLNTPDPSELQGSTIETVIPTEASKMAAVILSIIPVLVLYPFLQQYFTKGVLLGSIKG
ncbi:carbohydrate ABC transporter permease [Paenibacillus sp. J5C_2022]|uniref:carbohydrate ABC transporter permease n=1 Tax=Paenibacillus sp. J5C2022 TaxID=2977129 RepID=UPI0021D3B57D|nr:carbohydrate ABC transporter permease [Paenibacillus sp. J5C2022]MCU6709157.1 carbohydrate ABC transporter permease [Paenibacillus sp. J5C2022]